MAEPPPASTARARAPFPSMRNDLVPVPKPPGADVLPLFHLQRNLPALFGRAPDAPQGRERARAADARRSFSLIRRNPRGPEPFVLPKRSNLPEALFPKQNLPLPFPSPRAAPSRGAFRPARGARGARGGAAPTSSWIMFAAITSNRAHAASASSGPAKAATRGTAFARACSRVANAASRSRSNATTRAAPSSAATNASVPVPQPTSRTRAPRRSSARSSRTARRVDSCEPVPNARTAGRRAGGRREARASRERLVGVEEIALDEDGSPQCGRCAHPVGGFFLEGGKAGSSERGEMRPGPSGGLRVDPDVRPPPGAAADENSSPPKPSKKSSFSSSRRRRAPPAHLECERRGRLRPRNSFSLSKNPFSSFVGAPASPSNAAASFSTASFCACVIFFGTRIVTRTCWSPLPRPSRRGMPLPLSVKTRPAGRARRQLERGVAVQRRHLHRAAHRREMERNRPGEDHVARRRGGRSRAARPRSARRGRRGVRRASASCPRP